MHEVLGTMELACVFFGIYDSFPLTRWGSEEERFKIQPHFIYHNILVISSVWAAIGEH